MSNLQSLLYIILQRSVILSKCDELIVAYICIAKFERYRTIGVVFQHTCFSARDAHLYLP